MPTPTTSTQPRCLWQHPAWPALAFDASALAPDLDLARLEQGKLLGLLSTIGMAQAQEVRRELWVQEALATAAIEGENLNLESVRSSVSHRLGLADAPSPDRHVDGLVLVMQDAMENHQGALDLDRLCRWQSALCPGGTSGIARIAVGRLRDHVDAMQIVSGPLGREVVHYEAPPSNQVAQELDPFLAWFASTRRAHSSAPALHGVARAALAHLWFESIHPFEDGNGRLGRAVADMALAQDMHTRDPNADGALVRVFGMARQMLKTRAAYYDGLNTAQRIQQPAPQGDAIDVTPWVRWFVQALRMWREISSPVFPVGFGRAASLQSACVARHTARIAPHIASRLLGPNQEIIPRHILTQGCIACQAVVKHAVDQSAFRVQAAQCGLNARQHKVLTRLLEAGNVALGGGFLGGMTTDKYAKLTGASKATATRDLSDLLAKNLLRVEGLGKATRYAVNVPDWSQPVVA